MEFFSRPDAPLTKYLIDLILEKASARPDRIKDDAAALGTQAHQYIDRFIKGEKLEAIPDEILKPVSAFAEWWTQSGFKFVSGDLKVASRKYGYGGSLDALAGKNGKLVLLDWKTSKAIYDEYALQVAAYARGLSKTYRLEARCASIVRFNKPGVTGVSFEACEIRDINLSFSAFLDAKGLSEKMKQEHFIR